MALLSIIRRWAFRDQLSIRAISRRNGLSRNTIRKYLRSGAVEPKFTVPERPTNPDPFSDKLSHLLRVEASKFREQKRTVKRLHADLVALGYDGSYGRVVAFVREWKADRQRMQQTTGRGVSMPLAFQLGEAVPIRLERGLGDPGRRADQAAVSPFQAVAQPRLYPAGKGKTVT